MQQTKQLLEKHEERDLEGVEPRHERLCSYWAGCDPFTGEEGNCDCKPKYRQTTLDEYI